MSEISIDEFIAKEKEIVRLKQQLIASVWKPKIKTYICRRDRGAKRKLLINLEVNDIKLKKNKKWIN